MVCVVPVEIAAVERLMLICHIMLSLLLILLLVEPVTSCPILLISSWLLLTQSIDKTASHIIRRHVTSFMVVVSRHG